jgi:hypothetical protein
MSEERGSFLINGTCPECELSRGKHEVWCSAHDLKPAAIRPTFDPSGPGDDPPAADDQILNEG